MPNRATEVTMDLPIGQDYLWFRDMNVVGLSSHLDDAGRACALAAFREEFLAESCGGQDPMIPTQQHVTVHVTVPIASLPNPYAYADNRARQPL